MCLLLCTAPDGELGIGYSFATYKWSGGDGCPTNEEQEGRSHPDVNNDDSNVDTSVPGTYQVYYWAEDLGEDCATYGGTVTMQVTVMPNECAEPPPSGKWTDPSGEGTICLDPETGKATQTVSIDVETVIAQYQCDGNILGEDGTTDFDVTWAISPSDGVEGQSSGSGKSVAVTVSKPNSYTVTFTMVDKSSGYKYCSAPDMDDPYSITFEAKKWECLNVAYAQPPVVSPGPYCLALVDGEEEADGNSVTLEASATPGDITPPRRKCGDTEEDIADGWEIKYGWVLDGPEAKQGEGLSASATVSTKGSYSITFWSKFVPVGSGPVPCAVEPNFVESPAVEFNVVGPETHTVTYSLPRITDWSDDLKNKLAKAPMVKSATLDLGIDFAASTGTECCDAGTVGRYYEVEGSLAGSAGAEIYLPPPFSAFGSFSVNGTFWGYEYFALYGKWQAGVYGGLNASITASAAGHVSECPDKTCVTGVISGDGSLVIGIGVNAEGVLRIANGAIAVEVAGSATVSASVGANLSATGALLGCKDVPTGIHGGIGGGELVTEINFSVDLSSYGWGVFEYSWERKMAEWPGYTF